MRASTGNAQRFPRWYNATLLPVEASVKLPEQLPNDPDELERLYQAYAQADDFEEDEFKRIMDARLAVWGIDPHQMTPEQIFGAMAESMNSMLLNLYAAQNDAPDDPAAEQVSEIIKMAEHLREQIDAARHSVTEPSVDEPRQDAVP
jgi:hypothetical protein